MWVGAFTRPSDQHTGQGQVLKSAREAGCAFAHAHLVLLRLGCHSSIRVDVREVELAAGAEHTVCLSQHPRLVWAQVHYAVADDDVHLQQHRIA